MTKTAGATKRTFLWHYKPDTKELKKYNNMMEFRRCEPKFHPDDGTQLIKGRCLQFKTVERVVIR